MASSRYHGNQIYKYLLTFVANGKVQQLPNSDSCYSAL